MPRQLPWLSTGGRGRTQVKKPLARKPQISSEFDDSFFNGTVLASNSKGKERAAESDDDLPDRDGEPSTARTNSRTKDVILQKRAESSSPPPIADYEPPQVVSMRKGASKFDLRDDEWMMVEDELLETAKLFTRHLHIAEYERLKQKIEAKKKEAEAVRPVVERANMSSEGAMRIKAKVQENKQRRAIQEFFASPDDDDSLDVRPARTNFKKATSSAGIGQLATTASKRSSVAYATNDSESDDLDAPFPTKTAPRIPSVIAATNRRLSHATTSSPADTVFIKPAPPLSANKSHASKTNRATPFDLLDDYTPRQTHFTSRSSADPGGLHLKLTPNPRLPSSSPVKSGSTPSVTSVSSKIGPPTDSLDDWGGGRLSKETADRLAKRKAERENEEKVKKRTERKTVRSDEIPTFLF